MYRKGRFGKYLIEAVRLNESRVLINTLWIMVLYLLKLYSRFLSWGLILLGFSACNNEQKTTLDNGCKYDTLTATFKVKGKVVSGDKPLSNIRVIMIESSKWNPQYGASDPVYTNRKGEFILSVETFPQDTAFRLLLDSTDNTLGNFKSSQRTVKFRNSIFWFGDGCYAGEIEKDMGIISVESGFNNA